MTPAVARARVDDYLAACDAEPWLNAMHHPTPEGAVKVIFCRDAADREAVRAAFDEAMRERQ